MLFRSKSVALSRARVSIQRNQLWLPTTALMRQEMSTVEARERIPAANRARLPKSNGNRGKRQSASRFRSGRRNAQIGQASCQLQGMSAQSTTRSDEPTLQTSSSTEFRLPRVLQSTLLATPNVQWAASSMQRAYRAVPSEQRRRAQSLRRSLNFLPTISR